PYQHFVAAVFRAVETKRPLIRCANTGISAYIDEFGKIKSATALNEKTILTVDVKLSANPRKTFYTNYGNAFIFLCMGMLTFLIFKKW
ncbi:MAG TPA: nitrilase-related carbon-nitrogen hydrolase, partial [Elusimicrobiales bacterium]|nr:nitrilase-related carbon-nitrogen hydrolase [Elusimicrobiales bacterium]